MSSLEQLPKFDNRQNAEFEIESGKIKARAKVPTWAFLIICLATMLVFFARSLIGV